ncbi:MAG: phosphate ABC transporter substrate-binding protein PstS [Acetobacteraceae bacterium]|nr:phosphate ABC transporter substrate-binding protein PstS [Acetobacteraceae bacterium]
MRTLSSALLLLGLAVAPAAADEIHGSGSTFCFTVMAEWAKAYGAATRTSVIYQPIGSSAGMTEIHEGVVDFAVSEIPLNDAQLLRDGLTQAPLLIGAVVPVVNLPGIGPGQLRLTGPLLADIYLGKTTRWNDPAIAALNPGLSLPNTPVVTIHRTDGSGTTFVWTSFLSKVSLDFRARIGQSAVVRWPDGFGGKGNGDVAAKVARARGGLGYIDYAYAASHDLPYALVANRAGQFVSPDVNSLLAALERVEWKAEEGYDLDLSDAASANAYPIVAVSFAILRIRRADPKRTAAVAAFLHWAMHDGSTIAAARAYLPLPQTLVRQIEEKWPVALPQ